MSLFRLKNILTALFTVLAVQAFSQVTVNGTVSSNGNGVSGILVNAFTNGAFSTGTTNASGNYTINLSASASQGAVHVHLMDCDSTVLADTVYFSPASSNLTVNFTNYCDTTTGGGGGTPCNAAFTSSNQGNVFTFTPSGSYTNYSWNFGDNNTSNASNPTHTYSNPGNYVVCLTVSDSLNNCTHTFCDSITVSNGSGGGSGPCSAMFTSSVMNDSLYTFTPQVIDSSWTYNWTFGNGSTHTGLIPSMVFLPGTYVVCLTVTDSVNNCTNTICDSIVVSYNPGGGGSGNGNCNANFNYQTAGNGTYYFLVSSSNLNATYFWDFGDSNTSTSNNPAHTYSNNGTYVVTLTVTDSANNCTDTHTDSIVVSNIGNNLCNANFVKTLSGNTATFSPIVNSNQLTYSWTFGDGSTSNQVNPSHTYATNGTYTVCLTVTDSSTNCNQTFCDSVIIAGSGSSVLYIKGQVMKNNNPAQFARVYLIKYNQSPAGGILVAVDSTVVDSLGFYLFDSVLQGNYYVKAALLTTSSDYNNFLPTYHVSSLHWSTATLASPVPMSSTTTYNINMIGGTNTGGPGFIGGSVSQGANKKAGAGDPIQNALVILFNSSNQPLKYTYTTSNGKFEFKNLPNGTYKVYTEIAGIPTTPVTVTLKQGDNKEERVVVKVNSKSVTGFVDTSNSVQEKALSSLKAFPNPMNNVLNIQTGELKGELEISVIDISGRTVFMTNSEANGQAIELNVSDFPNGIYMLNIKGVDFKKTFKLIK